MDTKKFLTGTLVGALPSLSWLSDLWPGPGELFPVHMLELPPVK